MYSSLQSGCNFEKCFVFFQDNFKFLRRDDLETRRSASVPVTTHSSAPPTNYAYGGKQQSFRTDPATQFRTIGQHKNNKEDFKMANNIGGRGDRNFAADAIDHENSYFSESVSTRNLDTHTSVIFSQNKSSASFMPVASSHLQHGEFGNSSNPNRYTEDIDAAPPQTMLFSNSKRSDYDKRSQYEPKHDNYVQTRYNPLSFGDRRLTARGNTKLCYVYQQILTKSNRRFILVTTMAVTSNKANHT